jgi:hypothetical protein
MFEIQININKPCLISLMQAFHKQTIIYIFPEIPDRSSILIRNENKHHHKMHIECVHPM